MRITKDIFKKSHSFLTFIQVLYSLMTPLGIGEGISIPNYIIAAYKFLFVISMWFGIIGLGKGWTKLVKQYMATCATNLWFTALLFGNALIKNTKNQTHLLIGTSIAVFHLISLGSLCKDGIKKACGLDDATMNRVNLYDCRIVIDEPLPVYQYIDDVEPPKYYEFDTVTHLNNNRY